MPSLDLLNRRNLLGAAAAAAAVCTMPRAFGQNFPSRPVTLVVPWPAGGATDAVMRALAQAAAKPLGQAIVIDNKAGATGTLGPAQMAATAKPDGYVISQMPMGVYRLPLLQKVSYDPVKDFTYIIRLTGYTQGIVSKSRKWNSFQSMVAYARANPGSVTYATGGHGSTPHITMEQISRELGIKLQHVPYKGGTEALNAVLGDHVDLMAGETIWAASVQAGSLALLVTWSPTRPPLWRDAPTLREAGVNVVSTAPYGLAGPAGMDANVVKALHDAFRAALEDPTVVATLGRLGQESAYLSTPDYIAYSRAQPEEQRKLLGSLGMLEAKP